MMAIVLYSWQCVGNTAAVIFKRFKLSHAQLGKQFIALGTFCKKKYCVRQCLRDFYMFLLKLLFFHAFVAPKRVFTGSIVYATTLSLEFLQKIDKQ